MLVLCNVGELVTAITHTDFGTLREQPDAIVWNIHRPQVPQGTLVDVVVLAWLHLHSSRRRLRHYYCTKGGLDVLRNIVEDVRHFLHRDIPTGGAC